MKPTILFSFLAWVQCASAQSGDTAQAYEYVVKTELVQGIFTDDVFTKIAETALEKTNVELDSAQRESVLEQVKYSIISQQIFNANFANSVYRLTVFGDTTFVEEWNNKGSLKISMPPHYLTGSSGFVYNAQTMQYSEAQRLIANLKETGRTDTISGYICSLYTSADSLQKFWISKTLHQGLKPYMLPAGKKGGVVAFETNDKQFLRTGTIRPLAVKPAAAGFEQISTAAAQRYLVNIRAQE